MAKPARRYDKPGRYMKMGLSIYRHFNPYEIEEMRIEMKIHMLMKQLRQRRLLKNVRAMRYILEERRIK